mmetsp:Transcript_52439/g.157319  ORF Transcript_52439/g.157319 Transcript_52439/m.157319 type:complete len:82 (+) Transcript_52439:76-321(+)
MTWKIPVPEVTRTREWCVLCREFYRSRNNDGDSSGVSESTDEKGQTVVVTIDGTAGGGLSFMPVIVTAMVISSEFLRIIDP